MTLSCCQGTHCQVVPFCAQFYFLELEIEMSRHTFLALRVAFAILPCVIASTPTLSSRHLKPARCSSMIDMPTPLSSADLAVADSPLSARRRPTGRRTATRPVSPVSGLVRKKTKLFRIYCVLHYSLNLKRLIFVEGNPGDGERRNKIVRPLEIIPGSICTRGLS